MSHTPGSSQSCLRARSLALPPAAAARFISDALLNKSTKVGSCAGCFFFIQRDLTGLHLKFLRHIYKRKCNTLLVVPCRPFFCFQICVSVCMLHFSCHCYFFSRSYPYIVIEPVIVRCQIRDPTQSLVATVADAAAVACSYWFLAVSQSV